MDNTKVTEALANIVDIYSGVAEATAGYRARLEQLGFSPTAAESMAADFHRGLLAMTMQP